MEGFWYLGWVLQDLNKDLEKKRQELQEKAIEELRTYFALPYAIQRKYAPMYSPGLLKFMYLENVSEKINERKLSKGKLDKGELKGDVLRNKEGRLLTLEDIIKKEIL